jgi:hypothetical protein
LLPISYYYSVSLSPPARERERDDSSDKGGPGRAGAVEEFVCLR